MGVSSKGECHMQLLLRAGGMGLLAIRLQLLLKGEGAIARVYTWVRYRHGTGCMPKFPHKPTGGAKGGHATHADTSTPAAC